MPKNWPSDDFQPFDIEKWHGHMHHCLILRFRIFQVGFGFHGLRLLRALHVACCNAAEGCRWRSIFGIPSGNLTLPTLHVTHERWFITKSGAWAGAWPTSCAACPGWCFSNLMDFLQQRCKKLRPGPGLACRDWQRSKMFPRLLVMEMYYTTCSIILSYRIRYMCSTWLKVSLTHTWLVVKGHMRTRIIYIYIHMYAYIYIWLYIYIYVYMCSMCNVSWIYIRTHTHTHIHIYQ